MNQDNHFMMDINNSFFLVSGALFYSLTLLSVFHTSINIKIEIFPQTEAIGELFEACLAGYE